MCSLLCMSVFERIRAISCCPCQVWKWWEEDAQLPEGVKWQFLEHKGPLFAPAYDRLPDNVRFWYDGKVSASEFRYRHRTFRAIRSGFQL